MDQLTFGKTAVPAPEPESRMGPALVTKFPGPSDRKYHAETLLAYLTNIERLAVHVRTIEDWQLASVDLLDNCRAALVIVKCMA